MNPESQPGDKEIAEVARELWKSRSPGVAGSAEDDWYRAVEIVRKRQIRETSPAVSTGAGNSPPGSESNNSGTVRTKETQTMENSQTMDSTTSTDYGQSAGSFSGSVSDKVNSVKDRLEDAKNSAGQYIDDMKQSAGQYVQDQPSSTARSEHREGSVARTIEQQTAKLPSDMFLWAALGSIGLSLALELSGREKTATFVGHWAPTLLILGLYNKMVKLHGSDGV